MPRFLRTVLHQNVVVTAGAVPIEKDLGVNPISFLTLTLRALGATANTVPTLANILAIFANVEVLFKGTTIVGGRLADLVPLLEHLWRTVPRIAHRSKVLNDVLILTTHIPFTRIPYWLKEAMPATRKGDLSLKLTPAAAFTNVGTVTVQVEQTELLDATPEQFIKVTTKTKTPSATGNDDIDMPLGNPLIGVLLFGTTVPDAGAFTASISTVKFLVDNVETDYSLTNWESLWGDGSLRGPQVRDFFDHLTHENLGGVYAQHADSGLPQYIDTALHQHAYLDFDPLKDDNYLLDTEGRGRVHLQINFGVADAVRALPVELIRLPGAAAAARAAA